MSEPVGRVAELLRACATHVGRVIPSGFDESIRSHLSPSDAELIVHGIDSGVLSVDGNYLKTLDPFQGTAWLVEGDPIHPCWEYLPHAAAYVELVSAAGVPASLIRFETPDSEFNLDIAVLQPTGRVAVLGEAKARSRQLESLIRLLGRHVESDPGKPLPIARGGPSGSDREAWKLAHQLWRLQPGILWLIGPGDRRAFSVEFEVGRMRLTSVDAVQALTGLPTTQGLGETPRILAVD